MNWLKKLTKALLLMILVELIMALSISLVFQKVLIHEVVKETIKKQIITNVEVEEKEYQEKINELLENEEVSKLMDDYLNIALQGLTEEEQNDEELMKEKTIEFIEENREILENEFNVTITDEDMNHLENESIDNKIMKITEEIIEIKKELTDTEKLVLKIYSYLISNTFRILMILSIMITLILLCLLEKNAWVWIKYLTQSTIFTGIGFIAISMAVKYIVQVSTYNSLSINISKMSLYGVIMTLSSLFLLTIYTIIAHAHTKKELENEINSEKPNQGI